jgi:hypothetical protein
MNFQIKHQESYSRGELLLRTFFGIFYIALPHFIVLYFLMLVSGIFNFITFWAILFTGKFPKSMFEYQLNLMRWQLRVNARMNNLSDGYPGFGLNKEDAAVVLDIEYPETSKRGLALARVFFGVLYVYLPHAICLIFLAIAAMFVNFVAFWIVLFTGKYPEGMHSFMVGVSRWSLRVGAYMSYMTDTYPPFSTK